MKIALVFNAMDGPDSTSSSLSTSEHLGLGYLAASLRLNDHEVLLINSEVEALNFVETLQKVIAFKPDMVGCSPVSLSINNTLSFLQQIKEIHNEIRTVLGGHLSSMCAEDIMNAEPFVDFILKGDAEFSLPKLIARITAEDPDLVFVPGLVYRDSLKAVREMHASGSYHQLDDYPTCDRDDLEILSSRKDFDKSARILASRGCFYKCSFCTTPNFYGTSVRFRDHQCVIKEMNDLNEKFGITHFWFNDDLFVNGTPENTAWIERFTDHLAGNQMTYSYRVLCRADSFRRKNHHLLDRMIATGLTHIFFGIESGSQNSLEIYNKKTTVAHSRTAVDLIKSKNVELQIGFIMFNPYSTFSDITESARFLFDIEELYRWFPLTRPLSVFPGTMIASRLAQDGLLISNSYREPMTCYVYREEKVAYLANLMYEFYNKNNAIDRQVNRALKNGARSSDSAKVKTELSAINLRIFLKLIDQISASRSIDHLADKVLLDRWVEEVLSVLDQVHIIG
jgi:anaerobic magnesium-protoporphyrin IX monomethyl ester cyclase